MNEGPPIQFYYAGVLAAAVLIGGLGLSIFLRTNAREYRYRFYELRDRLIHIVAMDVVRESDEVFQAMYTYLNTVIPEIENLRWHYLTWVAFQKLTPRRKDEMDRFVALVMASDPSLRDIVRDICASTKDVIENRNRLAVFLGEFMHDRRHRVMIDAVRSWVAAYNVVSACDRIMAETASINVPRRQLVFQN